MPTNNQAIIIGWVGIEKYDIILYLAKLTTCLNKKVLLIDRSENEALSYCIPTPTIMNAKTKKITYRNIDFIKDRNVSDFVKDYDYIFIDFGFKTTHADIYKCSKLIIVTDKQQHNINKIYTLRFSPQDALLVLKTERNKKEIDALQESIRDQLQIDNIVAMEFDEIDKEKMILLQYNNEIKVKRLSGQYVYLLEQIMTMILNFDSKDFGQAYKQLKRGA